MDEKIISCQKKLHTEMRVKQKSPEHIVVKKDRILFNDFRLSDPSILQKKLPYDSGYRQVVRIAFAPYLELPDKMRPRTFFIP